MVGFQVGGVSAPIALRLRRVPLSGVRLGCLGLLLKGFLRLLLLFLAEGLGLLHTV